VDSETAFIESLFFRAANFGSMVGTAGNILIRN
jgi:hypothetical protein